MRSSALSIYLRDHEAAAGAGLALFRRAARNQARRPWSSDLADLTHQVRTDVGQLRHLMKSLGISSDPVLRVALRAGEFVGRAKPNGRLIRRSPLSDLIEVEALSDAVHAKQRGWDALLAVALDTTAVDLPDLRVRSENQLRRLDQIHRDIAAEVLRD